MADVVFNSFKTELLKSSIDFESDTFKAMLVTSSYTPDPDNHGFIDDVTNEVEGIGYIAGGKALANLSVTQDNVDNEGVFDADDVVWPASTITARGAVIYKDTGDPATSPLIAYIDFESNKISDNGDLTLQWGSEGILNVN